MTNCVQIFHGIMSSREDRKICITSILHSPSQSLLHFPPFLPTRHHSLLLICNLKHHCAEQQVGFEGDVVIPERFRSWLRGCPARSSSKCPPHSPLVSDRSLRWKRFCVFQIVSVELFNFSAYSWRSASAISDCYPAAWPGDTSGTLWPELSRAWSARSERDWLTYSGRSSWTILLQSTG